ncbi:MAG: transcriptional repressor LexA [Gammaproteobacteria bacterium]|nr:transcriptional repressor LexA [Gammaproteobacteria bacterium]
MSRRSDTLTERQQAILEFLQRYQDEFGMAPTRMEIGEAFGFTPRAADDHLKALERKGVLRLRGDIARGIQLLQLEREPEQLLLPVIGRVAAGSPILAVENIERYVPIPPLLARHAPEYILTVRGDSMKDAGILDGDLLVVRRTDKASYGQIVVARIDDEVTVKQLALRNGRPVLLPMNPDYQPIEVDPEQLVIEGLYVGLIRESAQIAKSIN